MIDTQAIRNKILDLAIQGKLTKQLPEDGTAEELYRQIQEEKQELIKTGKIKKEKPLPKITEDEIPFEIPRNWKWVRWGDLSFQIQYGYNAPAKEKGRVRMVRITDIQNNRVVWQTVPFCYIDEKNIDEYLLRPNNILFARTGGTVGKSYLVENVEENAVFAGYLIRTSFSANLIAKYMKFFMESRLYWKQLQDGTTATAQPNCNAKTLSKMLFPLPSLAEQKRIVEKIEQTFSILDTIDELQTKYADNLSALKSKLIDLAIQGKLTKQLPEDGTAEELYQQIQEEKQELIKAGKIKKEKPLPKITEDEIPFDIPESWKWVRLPELCTMPITDGTHQTPTYSDKETGIPFLSAKDVTTGKINWSKIKYITKDLHEELYKRLAPQKNDILLAKNGTTGVAALVENDVIFDVYVTLAVIRPNCKLVIPKFLLSAINSPVCKNQFNSCLIGIGVPNLHLVHINRTIIPLPPLAEQKRIVEKLEEVLELLY